MKANTYLVRCQNHEQVVEGSSPPNFVLNWPSGFRENEKSQ